MSEQEFFEFCENFDVSLYPESYQEYMKKQIVVIQRHIKLKRNLGDERTENTIVIEWVKGKNSSLFRKAWVLDYCDATKINNDEYNIPTRFYIKKR